MPEERKPQAEDKYIIRFPDGMRDRLKEAAKANNRTMNAEIVARLEKSFESPVVETNSAFTALSLRLAQAELQLAETQLEAEMLAVDANIAAGIALQLVKFNSENKFPYPIPNADIKDMQALYEETCDRIDEVDEQKYKELHSQAEAALDRLAKLRATTFPPSPRRFGLARFASKKTIDH